MRVTFHNLDAIGGSAWEQARGYLREELERLQATINTTWVVAHDVDGTQNASSRALLSGTASGTLAEQPLGLIVDDDGFEYSVTDFGHKVRWNGATSTWGFAPGDEGSGYYKDFAVTPQAVGWALCDGSTVTYLVVGGAALASASIVLPNLSGSPAYRKSAAAHTGTIVAAGGSTATGTTGTDVTGNESSHTHPFATGLPSFTLNVDVSVPTQAVAGPFHGHSGTTGTPSAHAHTVPGLSIPALGVGSVDMAHLNVLPYFRR